MSKKRRIAVIIFAALLALSVIGLAATLLYDFLHRSYEESGNETVIFLYQNQPTDNGTFSVSNMFPGDEETKNYCIKVSHSGSVPVYFRTEIRQDSEKLAEVIKIKVVMAETGETLYDGFMSEMPEIAYFVEADGAATTELNYGITVYLDTSVGNDYAEKDFTVDFVWSVSETGRLVPRWWRILPWLILMALSFIVLVCLFVIKKKEKPQETEPKEQPHGEEPHEE